VQNVEHIA